MVCFERNDGAEFSKKVVSGRRVVGAIMSLVNAKDLQLECARVLHETLLALVLMYGSETMLWKEKERSRKGCADGQPQRIARY